MWLIFKSPSGPPYDERAAREPEGGGSRLIILQHSESLTKVLLPAQFDVTKVTVSDFIKQNFGENSKSASVVGGVQLSEKGVITLDIQVDDNQAKTFTMTIDKWTYYDKLIFSVPEKSYSVTLPVYTN